MTASNSAKIWLVAGVGHIAAQQVEFPDLGSRTDSSRCSVENLRAAAAADASYGVGWSTFVGWVTGRLGASTFTERFPDCPAFSEIHVRDELPTNLQRGRACSGTADCWAWPVTDFLVHWSWSTRSTGTWVNSHWGLVNLQNITGVIGDDYKCQRVSGDYDTWQRCPDGMWVTRFTWSTDGNGLWHGGLLRDWGVVCCGPRQKMVEHGDCEIVQKTHNPPPSRYRYTKRLDRALACRDGYAVAGVLRIGSGGQYDQFVAAKCCQLAITDDNVCGCDGPAQVSLSAPLRGLLTKGS